MVVVGGGVSTSNFAAGLGRRVALSRLLALSLTVPFAPQRAPALEAATADVRKLASARDKAAELLIALPKLAEEDSTMCANARPSTSAARGACCQRCLRFDHARSLPGAAVHTCLLPLAHSTLTLPPDTNLVPLTLLAAGTSRNSRPSI